MDPTKYVDQIHRVHDLHVRVHHVRDHRGHLSFYLLCRDHDHHDRLLYDLICHDHHHGHLFLHVYHHHRDRLLYDHGRRDHQKYFFL